MRPPILFLTVAFGVGLWAGLDPFVFAGAALWGVALLLIAAAAWLGGRGPLGAAVGIMGVAGLLWGTAAVREREATCTGRWAAGEKAGEGRTRAVIVRLADPAPAQGGIVDADVLSGACAGSVRLRWPEGTGARGGTTWVVAGRWAGAGGGGGVLVVRRTRALDLVPHGRGARRDAGIGGRRASARARGRAARRGGARGARRAGAGPMGPAVGGRVAVDCGRGRGGLGRPRLRSSAAPRAARRAGARRHARHRADQRVRLRYCGADRCAGQSHRDPARRRRGAGSRDCAGTLVACLGVGAPDRRRRGTGPGAARPCRPRRRPRAGRSHRDGRGVASGAVVGGGGGRCVVAVEFPAPPVADGGSPGVLCHGCRRDVVS